MRVIGLIGPKGSGKDTSYDILKEQKRVDGKISFAGPLKAICGEVFGLHFNLLNDADLKELPFKEPVVMTTKHIRKIINLCETYVPSVIGSLIKYRSNAVSMAGLEGRAFKTPRELMQIVGTDLIRERIYKRWHLEAAFSEKALGKLKQNGTYCVTDVRFENEHDFLAEMYPDSYKAYYVDRPEASKKLAEAVASGNAHASESDTQKIKTRLADAVIDNSGSLDDLADVMKTLDLGSDMTSEAKAPKSKFRFARD